MELSHFDLDLLRRIEYKKADFMSSGAFHKGNRVQRKTALSGG